MLTQAAALASMATVTGFSAWAAGAVVLGIGTAMVYPTLLAAIGDVAHPTWRARSVGIYRLWRDSGFAVGALLAGILADLASIEAAIYAVAALTAASGTVRKFVFGRDLRVRGRGVVVREGSCDDEPEEGRSFAGAA